MRDGKHWRIDGLTLHESAASGEPAPQPDVSTVDAAVTGLVRTIVALPEVRRFRLEGSLAEFGLGKPQASVELKLDTGTEVTLQIGDRTTTGAGLYAHVKGSDEVLQIGSLILSEIGGALFPLRGLAGGERENAAPP